MLDLDNFKRYNDTHGHAGGDQLLRAATAAWSTQLRASDLLARHGGEEFTLLLPECDERDALALVERLRAATPAGQTVSAGLAQWDGTEDADGCSSAPTPRSMPPRPRAGTEPCWRRPPRGA